MRQGKFTGQRPTFYHCATQPTNDTRAYPRPQKQHISLATNDLDLSHTIVVSAFDKYMTLTFELFTSFY